MGVSATNKSRPPMHRSIRHTDGSLISDEEWKSIRDAANHISHTHLSKLDPSGRLAAGQSRKKKFFKRHFLTEWNCALRALEAMAPLLSFCDAAWKADMVLGAVLPDDRPSAPLPSPAASHYPPPSRSATPFTPSSRVGPVPKLNISLRSRPAQSRASTPGAAPSSRSSSRPPLSTHRPPSSSQQEPSQPASKAASSKVKRKRDPSPAPSNVKKRKGPEASSSRAKSGTCIYSYTSSGANQQNKLEQANVWPLPLVPPSLHSSRMIRAPNKTAIPTPPPSPMPRAPRARARNVRGRRTTTTTTTTTTRMTMTMTTTTPSRHRR